VDLDPALVLEEDPMVYRPSEDSRLLLESVVLDRGERFLEVGTGTGLVALHAARLGPATATDVNPAAVGLARANARRNGLTLEVVRTNLAAGVRGPFDVVAFNPPYLEGRPHDELDRAWAGGAQGSEVSVRFVSDLPRILGVGGRAYLLLARANETARSLAESKFETRRVSSKRLFFEDLDVFELRRRDP
jgi:release factor glutamine methyltransferase